ncbi:MAG: hypothetical protein ACLUI3_07550 [Christensenellales bacterium]
MKRYKEKKEHLKASRHRAYETLQTVMPKEEEEDGSRYVNSGMEPRAIT